jgi:hypothetical protein
MLNKIIENKLKIHTRDISLATYSHTDSKIIIHGVLKDQRHVKIWNLAGEVKEPGTIHHMDVKLLIRPNPLTIEDACAQMLTIPMPECSDTLDIVEKLKGVEIKAGFSRDIRRIMGGNKGCTHLCKLVSVMAQEIVHGWLTEKNRENSPIPQDKKSFNEKVFLIDSCRMWEKDGPRVKALEEKIKKMQRE